MHAGAKLIIGILIFLVGVYWYWPGNSVAPILGVASNVRAFLTVFAGLFGLLLIFLGLIIAWIEYEDLKWESREKKEKKK
jgi:predicted membrane protein